MSTRTGTTGIAPFVIQDDAIPQPAAYADQLNKGWHARNTLAERDAMPLHYRGWGMVCVVTNDGNNNGVYQLTRPSSAVADDAESALMDNGNWRVFSTSTNGSGTAIPRGTGSPEGILEGTYGDLYVRTDVNADTNMMQDFLLKQNNLVLPGNIGYINFKNIGGYNVVTGIFNYGSRNGQLAVAISNINQPFLLLPNSPTDALSGIQGYPSDIFFDVNRTIENNATTFIITFLNSDNYFKAYTYNTATSEWTEIVNYLLPHNQLSAFGFAFDDTAGDIYLFTTIFFDPPKNYVYKYAKATNSTAELGDGTGRDMFNWTHFWAYPVSAEVKDGNLFIFGRTPGSGGFVSCYSNNHWIKVGPDGEQEYFTLNAVGPLNISFDADGYIYASSFNSSLFEVMRAPADGTGAWQIVTSLNTTSIFIRYAVTKGITPLCIYMQDDVTARLWNGASWQQKHPQVSINYNDLYPAFDEQKNQFLLTSTPSGYVLQYNLGIEDYDTWSLLNNLAFSIGSYFYVKETMSGTIGWKAH